MFTNIPCISWGVTEAKHIISLTVHLFFPIQWTSPQTHLAASWLLNQLESLFCQHASKDTKSTDRSQEQKPLRMISNLQLNYMCWWNISQQSVPTLPMRSIFFVQYHSINTTRSPCLFVFVCQKKNWNCKTSRWEKSFTSFCRVAWEMMGGRERICRKRPRVGLKPWTSAGCL